MQIISEADHENKNPFSIKEKGRLWCKEEDPIGVKEETGSCSKKEAWRRLKGNACLTMGPVIRQKKQRRENNNDTSGRAR